MAMQIEGQAVTQFAEAPEYSSVDALLDEALKMTFPASDPIALSLDRLNVGEIRGPLGGGSQRMGQRVRLEKDPRLAETLVRA